MRIDYNAEDGQDYELNLIDTPGHVDFTYEVSRSLAACEGAILLVDATQGVEAQTVANAYLAHRERPEIIPVLNKIDLPASPSRSAAQRDRTSVIGAHATRQSCTCRPRPGQGIDGGARGRRQAHPAAAGRPRRRRSRALIFDSHYDTYQGVIVYVRVMDGELPQGDIASS